MCLAVPGKIVSVNETDPLFRLGVVDFGGVTREVNLAGSRAGGLRHRSRGHGPERAGRGDRSSNPQGNERNCGKYGSAVGRGVFRIQLMIYAGGSPAAD